MWRARHWLATNSNHKLPHHLRFLLCRSTSTLALSSASSRDSAARYAQGAWFSRADHLFFPSAANGDHLQTISSIPYQESVSTIDSVLCSLPVLTNHMRQAVPVCFSSLNQRDRPQQHFGGRVGWADSCRFSESKAFGSAAEAVENLEADVEEFVREPVQIAETGEPGVSERLTEEEALSLEKKSRSRLRRRQRKIEIQALLKATIEYKDMVRRMCKNKLAPNVPFVRGLLLSWFEPFRDAILAEQKAIAGKEFQADRVVYGPYLKQLPPDMLAVVAMHKLTSLLMKEHDTGYLPVVRAATAVGEAVEQESEIFRIMNKRRKKRKLGEEMEEASADPDRNIDTSLQNSIKKMIKQQKLRLLGKTVSRERSSKPWGSHIQAKVGSRLIDIFMDVAYIHPPVSQSAALDPVGLRPAVRHEYRTAVATKKRPSRAFGVLTCDPLIWNSMEKSARFMEMPYMPMVVEPVKWTSYYKGGYIVLKTHLMRTHGAKNQHVAVSKFRRCKMKQVFEALDILGKTSWRINKGVHDVVEKIWADGGCLGDLVDRNNVEIPVKPDAADEQALKQWRKKSFKARRINSERHSQRCDIELKLSVARKYRNESRFYYPHNVDFRGRAYPMHPYLNHLGSDLCRGLLEFGEGHPLGSSGLRWLKIHLANVYGDGVDKFSFDGRIAFVDENIENIVDSAALPLDGKRWWLKAEDPFQCLAACMCIKGALESGDPESFVCHLPVQQDGSCNGLQHYAALGRDSAGAVSVNLTSGEKPSDVYSGIAARVKQIMERDALKDPLTFRQAEYARLLVGHVDRKLVKQTVMTSVYGVTYFGARSQILNRLEERNKENDDNDMFLASSYAARATLEALGEMFKEAKGIMGWLADCAKLVACENEPVRWTSPLGLPIAQPYRKPGWKMVKTSLQTLSLRNDNDQPVAIQRQKTAFPPNFVHSLDSTHMVMTATACGKAGICFAGVHDSFWTHARNVDKLNKILREKFVELYSQPILENLLKSFEKRVPHIDFPPIPGRGDFKLEQVLKADYFFS